MFPATVFHISYLTSIFYLECPEAIATTNAKASMFHASWWQNQVSGLGLSAIPNGDYCTLLKPGIYGSAKVQSVPNSIPVFVKLLSITVSALKLVSIGVSTYSSSSPCSSILI